MNIQQAKKQFIDFLYTRDVYSRPVTEDLYLTRCPYCGDSRTRYNTGHFYILIAPETDNQMVFYCQRCQEHGKVNSEVISLLDGDDDLLDAVGYVNKHGKRTKHNQGTDKQFMYFDVCLPDVVNPAYQKKIEYVENRLDIKLTEDVQQKLKVIVSPYDFLIKNEITDLMYKPNMMNILERNYVGFLSTGNSHILFRDITDTYEHPWLKYPITKESRRNYVSYSYASDTDVYSEESHIINLSEGVMDAIGVKEYFHKDHESISIAVCGRNYYAMIRYLISLGLFGMNTTLNLYMDNDKQFNNGREMVLPRYLIETTKALFGQVCVFRNLIGKDYGVKKDKIILDKRIL